MVGYRNLGLVIDYLGGDFIRHSDGGVSERARAATGPLMRLYQAFRWWGIGTNVDPSGETSVTLSGIPMVGYRNELSVHPIEHADFIRHSDGGVSERRRVPDWSEPGLYQAFRWWGIGTAGRSGTSDRATLSGIPMVGYRNDSLNQVQAQSDFIRHSDGGVSEPMIDWLSFAP